MNRLELTAKKELWTISVLHGTKFDKDERMIAKRDKILKRDDCTCHYCGWKSKDYQEIHHLDHNHDNFSDNNLVTVCPLCHQIFHLPTINTMKGGEVIWLPEMTQAQLNNFCINLFIAENNKTFSTIANNYFIELSKRKDFIDSYIGRGIGSADVGVFSEVILSLEDDKEALENIYKNIKILPNKNRFKTQIEFWSEEKDTESNKYYKDFERKHYKQMFEKFEKMNKTDDENYEE